MSLTIIVLLSTCLVPAAFLGGYYGAMAVHMAYLWVRRTSRNGS